MMCFSSFDMVLMWYSRN